jgi:hypothetical protein
MCPSRLDEPAAPCSSGPGKMLQSFRPPLASDPLLSRPLNSAQCEASAAPDRRCIAGGRPRCLFRYLRTNWRPAQ